MFQEADKSIQIEHLKKATQKKLLKMQSLKVSQYQIDNPTRKTFENTA
jgi:hypothetical protein